MKLLIIDSQARNSRGIPIHQLANADMVVGKDRRVLKDRDGSGNYTLTVKELDRLRDEADEVIERGSSVT